MKKLLASLTVVLGLAGGASACDAVQAFVQPQCFYAPPAVSYFVSPPVAYYVAPPAYVTYPQPIILRQEVQKVRVEKVRVVERVEKVRVEKVRVEKSRRLALLSDRQTIRQRSFSRTVIR